MSAMYVGGEATDSGAVSTLLHITLLQKFLCIDVV